MSLGFSLFSILVLITVSSAMKCPLNFHGKFISRVDCTKFYQCHEDGYLKLTSCGRGHEFNQKLQKCEKPKIPTCLNIFSETRKPYCPFNQTTTQLQPHETDCTKFYSCVNGLSTIMDCPAGTEYDPNKKICDWISEGGCTSQMATSGNPGTTTTEEIPSTTTTEDPTTTTPEDPSTTTDEPTTTTEITSSSTEDLTTVEAPSTTTEGSTIPEETTVGTPKPACSGSSVGFVPHETDCDKYYFCLNGIPQQLQCSNGMEFDSNLKTCVKISDDGCTASQSKSKMFNIEIK